jgi:hypothetical protein
MPSARHGRILPGPAKLGAAAMELLWALAADAPSVVLEANFRPHDQYQRGRLSALADNPVEVHCACDPGLAARCQRRYNDRARTCHPFTCWPAFPLTCVLNMTGRSVGIGSSSR